MSKQAKKPIGWVCPDCESDKVEELVWMKVNTASISQSEDRYYCCNCREEKKELKPEY